MLPYFSEIHPQRPKIFQKKKKLPKLLSNIMPKGTSNFFLISKVDFIMLYLMHDNSFISQY